MSLTKRVKVDFVQYRGADGSVLINVVPQTLDADGTLVGVLPVENVHTTQEALAASAKARGVSEWGDADIEAVILAATKPESIPMQERDDNEDAPTTRDVLRFPNATVVW